MEVKDEDEDKSSHTQVVRDKNFQETKDLLNSHSIRRWWRQTEGFLEKVTVYLITTENQMLVLGDAHLCVAKLEVCKTFEKCTTAQRYKIITKLFSDGKLIE